MNVIIMLIFISFNVFPPFLVTIYFMNKAPGQGNPYFPAAGIIQVRVILIGERWFGIGKFRHRIPASHGFEQVPEKQFIIGRDFFLGPDKVWDNGHGNKFALLPRAAVRNG